MFQMLLDSSLGKGASMNVGPMRICCKKVTIGDKRTTVMERLLWARPRASVGPAMEMLRDGGVTVPVKPGILSRSQLTVLYPSI